MIYHDDFKSNNIGTMLNELAKNVATMLHRSAAQQIDVANCPV